MLGTKRTFSSKFDELSKDKLSKMQNENNKLLSLEIEKVETLWAKLQTLN